MRGVDKHAAREREAGQQAGRQVGGCAGGAKGGAGGGIDKQLPGGSWNTLGVQDFSGIAAVALNLSVLHH